MGLSAEQEIPSLSWGCHKRWNSIVRSKYMYLHLAGLEVFICGDSKHEFPYQTNIRLLFSPSRKEIDTLIFIPFIRANYLLAIELTDELIWLLHKCCLLTLKIQILTSHCNNAGGSVTAAWLATMPWTNCAQTYVPYVSALLLPWERFSFAGAKGKRCAAKCSDYDPSIVRRYSRESQWYWGS